MAFFRPVHLWYHCGTGRTFVLSQHADVPIGGVTCHKYLLIIHLRKKISRPGEKCLEDNCVQVVPPAGGLRNEPVQ